MQAWIIFILLAKQLSALSRGSLVAESVGQALEPRSTIPAPVVVAASQDWQGNDGPWSSFHLRIGTPPQDVNVFISTSGHQTLAVIPQGCIATDPSSCESLRGGFFEPNASSTWQINTANLSSNIYPLLIDEDLGYTPRGELGFDNVTLGFEGSGGPTLDNQTVGGFEDKDFYLGYFGINPRASNFTSFDDPIPSYVQKLKERSLIPSLSWSYTAGNQYRFNQVLGSLVLGGYDTSKFVPNDVTFSFNSEDDRDLTLQIQAITMSDDETSGTSLLPSSIPAFVDSSLPFIWLPVEACTLFEKAFGLVWDTSSELYLLNSSHQATLQAQNANITFTLGNLTAGANVNITLPYSAFDLTVSSPIVNISTPYFPLKRATNSTQYTLGKTFFQEAYVTADYERGNFSVSQCSWVANSQQNIVAILPISDNSATNSTSGTSGDANSLSKFPVGAVVGGIVGGLAVLAAIGFLLWHFCIKPRRRKAEAEAAAAAAAKAAESKVSTPAQPALEDSAFHKAELENSEARRAAEMEDPVKNQWVVETDGNNLRPKNEMDGTSTPKMHEMEGRTYYEMDGKRYMYPAEADGREIEIHEMPAREEVAAEMAENREVATPAQTHNARWSWATTPGADLTSPERGDVVSPFSPPPIPRREVGSGFPSRNTRGSRSPESEVVSSQASPPSQGAGFPSPPISEQSPQSTHAQMGRVPR